MKFEPGDLVCNLCYYNETNLTNNIKYLEIVVTSEIVGVPNVMILRNFGSDKYDSQPDIRWGNKEFYIKLSDSLSRVIKVLYYEG